MLTLSFFHLFCGFTFAFLLLGARTAAFVLCFAFIFRRAGFAHANGDGLSRVFYFSAMAFQFTMFIFMHHARDGFFLSCRFWHNPSPECICEKIKENA